MMCNDRKETSSSHQSEKQPQRFSSQRGCSTSKCECPVFNRRRVCGGGVRRCFATNKRLRPIHSATSCRRRLGCACVRRLRDRGDLTTLACQSQTRSGLC